MSVSCRLQRKHATYYFKENPDPPTFSPKQQNDGVINHK